MGEFLNKIMHIKMEEVNEQIDEWQDASMNE